MIITSAINAVLLKNNLKPIFNIIKKGGFCLYCTKKKMYGGTIKMNSRDVEKDIWDTSNIKYRTIPKQVRLSKIKVLMASPSP